jgi:hypothetical protein
MILFYGDSNVRNMLEQHKLELCSSLNEEIEFKMVTSNESLKTQLESLTDEPKVIVIGTPLNEIVKTVSTNKNKGRDETIRTVIEEMSKIVHNSAVTRGNTLHLLVPPFFRVEPPWISKRIRLGVFYVREYVTSDSPWNIVVSTPVDITSADLVDDNVHLNKEGKQKLFKSLESDLKKCKDNLDAGNSSDWAMCEDSFIRTPATMKKRPREQDGSDEEDEEQGNKKAKLDTMIDKIDILVKEIQKERNSTKGEIENLANKVEESNAAVVAVKASFDALPNLTAEMREDIDGLENENLKSTVIVRKLKLDQGQVLPQDKKELRAFIQTKARKLVETLLDQDSVKGVKYAGQLYSFLDPSKKDNAVGLVPPFKIGFSSKELAIKFREAAIKETKVEGSSYKTTYFTFFQSAGTRVRTMIMWSVADAIKTETKDCWINQNSAKPTLQIKEGGKITRTLSYVKVVTEYKDKIPQKTLDEATKLAKKHFAGNLEKTFIVLKD